MKIFRLSKANYTSIFIDTSHLFGRLHTQSIACATAAAKHPWPCRALAVVRWATSRRVGLHVVRGDWLCLRPNGVNETSAESVSVSATFHAGLSVHLWSLYTGCLVCTARLSTAFIPSFFTAQLRPCERPTDLTYFLLSFLSWWSSTPHDPAANSRQLLSIYLHQLEIFTRFCRYTIVPRLGGGRNTFSLLQIFSIKVKFYRK